ncbi:NCA2-domain-containing protein [Auriscalpium vulgare]|uniref:NCA2-domain-containing protein n=1 Tax=Auriscalpium vulgare TaxID=40419 RepID=A0ACB8RGY9_9AGAM|nr:NCA2-domain-containing protein [Auriscalpium vulgare]
MSSSVSHLTNGLILAVDPSKIHPTTYAITARTDTRPKEALQALFVSLSPPLKQTNVRDALAALQSYESAADVRATGAVDEEEEALKDAILNRLLAGVYAEAMDRLLNEAIDVESEADWWSDVARSRLNVAYHLVQTLPSRLVSLAQNVLHILHSQQRQFKPSLLTISSVRKILSEGERETGRPASLAASLFPHLHTHPHLFPIPFQSLSLSNPFSMQSSFLRPSPSHIVSFLYRVQRTLEDFWTSLVSFVSLPLELTRQECGLKRVELERVRDERAKALGDLTLMRTRLVDLLGPDNNPGVAVHLRSNFLDEVNRIMSGRADEDVTEIGGPQGQASLVETLTITSSHVLPQHASEHDAHLRAHSLLRPSRLTLMWPRLVILPPLTLYLVREAVASQDTLIALAQDAWETLKGFWRGWLVEPIVDILNTVRTGGDEGMIVQKESIAADTQSLERMALSLAKDKLKYDAAQLEDLSKQLRVGDLTPILKIFEEDIRSPVRSAVAGSLLRSVFVQVQKAKVDIDQALSGIDKLLKSQELTFAFVGVAPALAILYISTGSLLTLYSGGRGSGRLGGQRRRTAAWLAMRRTERLLVAQPQRPPGASHDVAPLTAGLLLLSVSALRRYAEGHLPARSRLREGFLEDVGDLEDPGLNRDEKLLVVQRMWRSWGSVMGWQHGGGSIAV